MYVHKKYKNLTVSLWLISLSAYLLPFKLSAVSLKQEKRQIHTHKTLHNQIGICNIAEHIDTLMGINGFDVPHDPLMALRLLCFAFLYCGVINSSDSRDLRALLVTMFSPLVTTLVIFVNYMQAIHALESCVYLCTNVIKIVMFLFFSQGNSTKSYLCPSGHYCPSGTGYPLHCPTGSLSISRGLKEDDECPPCPPGLFCDRPAIAELSDALPCNAG